MTPEEALENFARNLRIYRGRAGFGSRELSRHLGMSSGIISHYETARRSPEIEPLIKICELLDTTPDILFGYRPMPGQATEEK